MKDFDEKWRTLADRARQAPPRDESAPTGFAARLAALLQTSREDIWEPLALRLLWGAATVLVVCAVLDAPYLRRQNLLDCGVEDCMAKVIWFL